MRLNEALSLDFTQSQVDFVIPDLTTDLPLSIDPFLMFKSRDVDLRYRHDDILSLFNHAIGAFRAGKPRDIDYLIDFPEVDEIGFGYSDGAIRGRGLGSQLNRLLSQTLVASPSLTERGLRHIEELQLVSLGIGPDRVSDIAANTLKQYLVEYTQMQCELWGIPLVSNMPVSHLFDFRDWIWKDDSFDLPMNPISGGPILLVPRRIVRTLPWINAKDYQKSDFRIFHQSNMRGVSLSKHNMVTVTRGQMNLLDSYINRKERERAYAIPELLSESESPEDLQETGARLVRRLTSIPPGRRTAAEYQRLLLEVFNFLFEPELTDGEMEEKTIEGTERRDLIFINESEKSFLRYIREKYASILLMVEAKNVKELSLDNINQTSAYLGTRLGMFGIIATRNEPGDNILRKTYSVFNDTPSEPRKVILVISDADLKEMVALRVSAGNPVKILQHRYRKFRTTVQ